MLSININQDVEQYQEAVAAGMNAKQTIAAIVSIIAVAIVVAIAYFALGIPLKVAIYVGIPVCIPIMLPALGKQYGLTVMERFRGSNKRKQVVGFSATCTVRKAEIPPDAIKKKEKQRKSFIINFFGKRKKEQLNENSEQRKERKESKEKRPLS